MRKINEWKEKWNTLKKCLQLEVDLTQHAYDDAKKEENWHDALLYREEQATVQWVLEQLEHIEETGDCK